MSSDQSHICDKCGFQKVRESGGSAKTPSQDITEHCPCCRHDGFGDQLKCYRLRTEAPKISQKELAEEIGVNQTTISHWEGKEVPPQGFSYRNLAIITQRLKPDGKKLDEEQRDDFWRAAARGQKNEEKRNEFLEDCLSEYANYDLEAEVARKKRRQDLNRLDKDLQKASDLAQRSNNLADDLVEDTDKLKKKEKQTLGRLEGLEKHAADGENQTAKMLEQLKGAANRINDIKESTNNLGEKQGVLISRASEMQNSISEAITAVLELRQDNSGIRYALSDARTQLGSARYDAGKTLHFIQELADRQKQADARAMSVQAEMHKILSSVSEVKKLADETLWEVRKTRHVASETHATVGSMANQVLDIWKYLEPYMNPKAQSIPADTVAGVIKNDGQRVLLLLILSGMGALLALFQVGGHAISVGYTMLALVLVMALGYMRVNPFRRNDSPDFTGRNPRFAELLFVSFFVVLNAPLLESVRFGVDIYGFFTISGLAGTLWPNLLNVLVNFAIALVAVNVFQLLWLREYGRSGSRSAWVKAIRVLLPAFIVAYVPAALLGRAGMDSYLLVAFVPMVAAFTLLLICTDPSVKLDEWSAKSLMNWSVGVVVLLTIAALLALFFFLSGVSEAPMYSGSHLNSWVLTLADLGYTEAEFVASRANGFIWFVITAMAYLIFVVGGSLIATIHSYQITPHHRNQQESASSA